MVSFRAKGIVMNRKGNEGAGNLFYITIWISRAMSKFAL